MRLTVAAWLAAATSLAPALPSPAVAARAQAALTLGEVVALHEGGVAPRQIARIANQYCVGFEVSDSAGRVLRASGIGGPLLDALRRACVHLPRLLPPDVAVDDDLTQGTRLVSADGLCIVESGPSGMRIVNRRTTEGCAVPYPHDHHDSARIELTIADLTGNGPGVAVLGYGKDSVSWDQHTVAITSDGAVEIGEVAGGRFRRSRLLVQVRALRDADAGNRIAVTLGGTNVALEVNDHAIAAWPRTRRVAGGISVGVGPRTTARFTRLVVRRAGPPAPAR